MARQKYQGKMNKKTNIILTIVLYLGASIQGVLCQTSGTTENKNAAPLQSSSNRQTAKNHFPSELFNYFKGDWSGAGKFAANGKDVASDFSFAPDLDNQSLVVHEKERAPNKYHFIALWSFDSATGNLMMFLADDSGAELFRSESGGWEDNKIVFQSASELKVNSALVRFTFERKSNDSFLATYEMSRDGKTWRIGDTQTFTRK